MSANSTTAASQPQQQPATAQNQPMVYEIRVARAVPRGNFQNPPHVVRMIPPTRHAIVNNPRALCGYLHLPTTQHLQDALQSIDGFLAVYREAESRAWFPVGDRRAGEKTTWNQMRTLAMFFPVKGNASKCSRFAILRQNVGLNRQPTINDLTDTTGRFLFSEVEMPAVGQAMAIVQLMARLPHLFGNCSNIAVGTTGNPVFHA